MIRNYLISGFLLLFTTLLNGQVFWNDNFESTGPSMGTRSAPNHSNTTDGSGPGVCGAGDYFFRTNLASDSGNGLTAEFTNINGAYYWRSEDLDGCITNPDIINFTGISISGKVGLGFKGRFGARENVSFEGADEIRIEYQIDGGGYITGLLFKPTATTPLRLQEDTDFDGIGDGGQNLIENLTEYDFLIPETGNTMDLRLTISANGGGEESGVDLFQLEENLALPITLGSLSSTVENDGIQLEWQTLTEVNNEHFIIERRTSHSNFERIAVIEGGGTTSEPTDYSFLDKTAQFGFNYYRLKQIDFDGSYTYSKVITSKYWNTNESSRALYPTIFEDEITLSINESDNNQFETSTLDIKIFDMLGRLQYKTSLSVEDLLIKLSLPQLSRGAYYVVIEDDKESVTTHKVIKI